MGVMLKDRHLTVEEINIPVKFVSDEGLVGIVDLYWIDNDPAHNIGHLRSVVITAQKICDKLGVEYSKIIELGCLFHDTECSKVDRSIHHIHAAAEFMTTIERIFDSKSSVRVDVHEISKVVECIVNHRSSNPFINKSSIEAQIVHAANKGIPATTKDEIINGMLKRSVLLSMNNDYVKRDQAHQDAYRHLMNKYSEHGYIKYSDIYKKVFAEEIKTQQRLVEQMVEEEWRYEF